MTPLSKREVDALTALCNVLIETCVENSHKITSIERSLKDHPQIYSQYQKELGTLKLAEPSGKLHIALRGLEQALMGRP